MGKSWDTFTHEDAGFCYWLSGLIDGEGCFVIKAHTRGTHAPYFALKLRADEHSLLIRIKHTLGMGSIYREDREPNPTEKWVVSDRAGCQRLVDLLDKYPLRAKKRLDFLVWREAVCEWTDRPRGNRWHGPADNSRMAALRRRLMEGRAYADVSWSGHGFQDWSRQWATAVLRVLKPGAHAVVCASPRMGHRVTCGLEDAGFEIRDSLLWLYGSGFPKSLNLPGGLGTSLKPAYEPVILARKPLGGRTVAQCVAEYGTGALNIDGCRLGDPVNAQKNGGANVVYGTYNTNYAPNKACETLGRWPPNVALDEDAAAMLDAEGGTSRFFYVAKASREERERGCEDLPLRTAGDATGGRKEGSAGLNSPRAGAGRTHGARNVHPTVKPVALMRWLVRLVTPARWPTARPVHWLGDDRTGLHQGAAAVPRHRARSGVCRDCRRAPSR